MAENKTTVVVTGGTGFIGRHLVAALPGYIADSLLEIRILASPGMLDHLGDSRIVRGDITQPDSLEPVFQNAHVLFHLAGRTGEPKTPSEVDEFWRVNVDGVRNVVRTAAAAGVRCIVHFSSIGIYGNSLAGIYDEHTPPSPVTVYQRTKLASEYAALEEATESGIRLIILRASNVFGEDHPCRVLLTMLRMIKRQQFFLLRDVPDAYANYIYVGDLVDAAIQLSTTCDYVNDCLIVNTPTTMRLFAGTAAEALGLCQKLREAPKWMLDVVASVMEKMGRRVGAEPPLTYGKVNTLADRRVFSSERLQGLLPSWPPFGISEGLVRLVSHYQERGWL